MNPNAINQSSTDRKPLKKRPKHFTPEKEDNSFLFLDEFLVCSQANKPEPNVPPELFGGASSLQDLLGHPFKHSESDSPGYHFDRYARLLLDAVRDYNRALYRLRRAHVYEEQPAAFRRMPALPDESSNFEIRSDGRSTLPAELFERIQNEFIRAAECLEVLLNVPNAGFPDPLNNNLKVYVSGNVDCIRVNDYIISVRIGAHADRKEIVATNDVEAREIAYSSSSHISVSSAFSSFSSDGNWQAGS